MSVNLITLIGNVGSMPKLYYVRGEIPLVKFSLATNDRSSNKDDVSWHRIVVWGDIAERVTKQVHAGSLVYVEGKLRYNTWADKNGTEQRDVVVQAYVVRKL